MSVWLFLPVSILLAAMPSAVEARACTCTDGSIEASVRQAERIFAGRVLSAEITDSKPQVIRFVVEVEERFRGEAAELMTLETPLPEDCGVDVGPGYGDLYVLHAGASTVDYCSGGGRAPRELPSPLLDFAVALTSYGHGQSDKALEWLRRAFYRDFPRDKLEQFLALVERIDPAGRHVTRHDASARYGDVRFNFRGDKLLSIEAVQ